MGRLAQHATWPSNRLISMDLRPDGHSNDDVQRHRCWSIDIFYRRTRACEFASLARRRPDRTRILVRCFAIYFRLCGKRTATVLALRSCRDGCRLSRTRAMARLEAER